MGEQQVLENFIGAEMLPAWTKRDKENKMKASCWTLKILQAGSRLIKLPSCKYMLPYMRKKAWLRRCLRLRR